MEILGLLLLIIPLLWELHNDRNGDAHITRGPLEQYNILSKKVDVGVRGFLIIIVSFLNYYINDRNILSSIGLSGAIHFLFFDYLVAHILIKKLIIRGHWYSYMGSKGIDNIKSWKNISPHLKLLIRIVIFIIFLTIYIK